MARPLRIEFSGAVYHVMNRGAARQPIFRDPHDRETFLQGIGECTELWGIEVFAYCLMDTHYHLCLRTPDGNLARVMRHLNGVYTQRFNRTHGRDGPLFRGRYKAIVIEAEAYLLAVIRYIHLNPVDAKLIPEPAEYPWSSHRAYLHRRHAPPWLQVGEIMERLGSARAFHAFVLAGNDEAVEAFYASDRHRPVLGGVQFGEWLRKKTPCVSREHPRHERGSLRPAVERVLTCVSRAYDVRVTALLEGRRGQANEARKVGMYLVKRVCDQTLPQVAGCFGVGSSGVVGWACHHVRVRMVEDAVFARRVKRIAARCNQHTS